MKVHHELPALRTNARPLALAIGFFDGVHRGHREILRALLRRRRPGSLAAVLTFETHPSALLRPHQAPPLITTLEERVNLLARSGIDELYLLPFDERIARLEARTFLEEFLVERLRLSALVVGENFRFGAGAQGDPALAQTVLSVHGVEVVVCPPLREGSERVSSTRIRSAIARGDLAEADRLLGEPYTLRGRVVLGEGRGHDLGFPTANIVVPAQKTIPKDGVYAALTRHAGRDYSSLVSIGDKPTFGGAAKAIEVWMLDFHETIYGEELSLREFRFLREQRRFAGVEELLTQMREDATHATFPSFVN
ncbi:MAG TPA: bifunctional riboflavin kinase/FAD synthetase [Candidatus Acidoferrales bacterium]|nr:bifunctional riboflavin kinase/FAD synthetase [Candidatus Acidoferrales bacterium]